MFALFLLVLGCLSAAGSFIFFEHRRNVRDANRSYTITIAGEHALHEPPNGTVLTLDERSAEIMCGCGNCEGIGPSALSMQGELSRILSLVPPPATPEEQLPPEQAERAAQWFEERYPSKYPHTRRSNRAALNPERN